MRQSTTIKKRINNRTGSPNQVINQAIMRMSKAYETTMNDLLLVRKENHDLRAAHEKEKPVPDDTLRATCRMIPTPRAPSAKLDLVATDALTPIG